MFWNLQDTTLQFLQSLEEEEHTNDIKDQIQKNDIDQTTTGESDVVDDLKSDTCVSKNSDLNTEQNKNELELADTDVNLNNIPVKENEIESHEVKSSLNNDVINAVIKKEDCTHENKDDIKDKVNDRKINENPEINGISIEESRSSTPDEVC